MGYSIAPGPIGIRSWSRIRFAYQCGDQTTCCGSRQPQPRHRPISGDV